MGIMVDELNTAIDDIKEEVSLILKEGFVMLVFQGIMDELPPSENTGPTFQNKSMPVVGEFQSEVLSFVRLHNELFSTEDDANKETSAMIS